jgi:putative membrane protein
MIAVVFALILLAGVAAFAAQNAAPVVISFLFWKFEASLAIVIFLSLLAGALLTAFTSFWIHLRKTRTEEIKSSEKPSSPTQKSGSP